MFKLAATLALIATALPVLADEPIMALPKPMVYFRDSDGLVISVICWMEYFPHLATSGGVGPGDVFYTFDGPVSTATGGVTTLPRDGSTLPEQPVFLGGTELLAAGNGGEVLDVGGIAYRVEAKGTRIWLRDVATGVRHAADRRIAAVAPDAEGLAVNPAQFALD